MQEDERPPARARFFVMNIHPINFNKFAVWFNKGFCIYKPIEFFNRIGKGSKSYNKEQKYKNS